MQWCACGSWWVVGCGCVPLSKPGGCRCCDGVLYRVQHHAYIIFFSSKIFIFFGGVGVGCLRRGAVSGCRVACGGVVFSGRVPPRGRGCQGCEGKDAKGTPYAPRAGPRPKPLLHSTIVSPHLFCTRRGFFPFFPRCFFFCALFVVCFFSILSGSHIRCLCCIVPQKK